MDVVLQLSEEALLYLQEQCAQLADQAYRVEDLKKGKFFEELTQQLERERWKG